MFSSRSLNRGIRARGRGAAGGLALIVGVLVLVAGPALGRETAEQETPRLTETVEEHFDVLPLREGLLLQPRDPDLGFRALEISGREFMIDGRPVSEEELRVRLGDLAEAVLSLPEIEESERAALLEERDEEEPEAGVSVESEEERRERPERRRRVSRSDANVVVGSSVTIEEDEVARDVVVIGGPLTIRGKVIGDAVAVGGPIEVSGEVTGDVAAVGASLELEAGARVLGDAVSVGGNVEQHPDAEVLGRVSEVPFLPNLRFGNWGEWVQGSWSGPVDVEVGFSPFHRASEVMWNLFGLGVLLLFACLVLLVARGPVERVGGKAAEEPWKSGLIGLLSQILFLPLLVLVIVILVVSIVGIPFLLLLPFAIVGLILVGLLGYTAVAYRVGRWSEARFGWNLGGPFIALLVGVGFIQIWSVIGGILSLGPGPVKFFAVMFSLFGALLCYATWTVGFGAALLTRFGTSPGWAAGGVAPSETERGPAAESWEVPLDETPALESSLDDESMSPPDWGETEPEKPADD